MNVCAQPQLPVSPKLVVQPVRLRHPVFKPREGVIFGRGTPLFLFLLFFLGALVAIKNRVRRYFTERNLLSKIDFLSCKRFLPKLETKNRVPVAPCIAIATAISRTAGVLVVTVATSSSTTAPFGYFPLHGWPLVGILFPRLLCRPSKSFRDSAKKYFMWILKDKVLKNELLLIENKRRQKIFPLKLSFLMQEASNASSSEFSFFVALMVSGLVGSMA